MRVLPLLTAFASLLSISVAQASSKVEAKIQKLVELSNSSKGPKGSIHLNDALFNEVTNPPRNHSALVLFTALDPRFGCTLCREFQKEYDLLGASWNKDHPKQDGLFITVLDFSQGKATFQRMGFSTAPILMYYPPTTVGTGAPIKYDFGPHETPAEMIARWLSQQTNQRVSIHRPFNYVKLGGAIGGLIGVATFGRLALPYLAPAFFSRNIWAALSLVAILLFTSGHMFNHIRKVPYVVPNRGGGVSYIAGGFQTQYGLETQVIAFVYGVLAFAAISLCLKMPRIENPGRQKIAVLVWNMVLLVLFSFLISIFKMKNGSYPFFLPPLIT